MTNVVKRVAVIGPESTGKSDLCRQLARHYNTIWIPEYARSYLPALNRPLTINDIVEIYKTQSGMEQHQIADANKIIFTDTEAIIARVWCEHVFGVCPDEISDMLEKQQYDYYLLTSPDIPWESDPLRENPGKGQFFFDWYRNILNEKKIPYGVVHEPGSKRIKNAIALIDKHVLSASG